MQKKSSRGRTISGRNQSTFAAEFLEPRQLFSALPTVKLVATVPTASGISGADAQFKVSRTGATTSPLKVYYHALSSSTINPHQYLKLTGEVTIHGGEAFAYIDVKPVIGLVVATNPALSLVLTQMKTYAASSHSATVTVTENNGGTTASAQRYYVPVTVNANGFVRTDEPVDNSVNLTTALASAGGSGAIEDSSLKVVETDSSGNVIDSNVPFQFDKASNYDATSNASGDLVLQMSGTTTASQSRFYRVYFDTQGTFTAPTFTPKVTVTSENDSVGLDSFAITNSTATYVMQKSTGGISAIVDSAGNDWVGHGSGTGSEGQYRGTPNLGIPDGLHPYDPVGNFPASGAENSATVTMTSTGPLKTTFNVESTDGNVNVTYEFYAGFVRVNVLQANETNSNGTNKYWMLYEGTPGGAFNPSDSYVLSDGTTNTLANSFTESNGIGNSTVGQWASFQSSSENRFIYFANDNASTIEDSYFDLNDQMTVFGFGRTGTSSNPSQVEEFTGPNSFTIGLADGNATAAATIDGQYQAVTASVGSGTAA